MIGVFDSGIGGLTVVKEIFKELPNYQIIYFGDTARLPYGTKGENFVKKYSEKIVRWLLKRKAKIIVIACNTASALASEYLKNRFKKIPIFDMINPAIKDVLSENNERIGVIGTYRTIKSGVYEKKILKLNSEIKIFSKSCPLLVPLIEEGLIESTITENIVKYYLGEFGIKKIDSLILGCTHYPLLHKIIKRNIGNDIKIINPAKSLAKELKIFIKNNKTIDIKIKKGLNHQFFFSDKPYNLDKIAKLCFNKKIKIKINEEII
jgi:glutamate racemase